MEKLCVALQAIDLFLVWGTVGGMDFGRIEFIDGVFVCAGLLLALPVLSLIAKVHFPGKKKKGTRC